MDLSLLPATKKYLDVLIDLVFKSIFQGQHMALYTIPYSGTFSMIQYLLNYPEKVNPGFAKQLESTLFIPLDLTNTKIHVQLWSQIEDSVFSLYKIKFSKEELLHQKKTVVFLVKYAELLADEGSEVLSEFTSLYALNSAKFQFIFFFSDLNKEEKIHNLLSNLWIPEEVIIPMKSREDTVVLLEKEEIWYGIDILDSIRDRILDLVGGSPALARSLLAMSQQGSDELFLQLKEEDIIQNKSIQRYLNKIFQFLTKTDQDLIIKICLNITKLELSDFLSQTKLVTKNDNKYEFFSPLFETYVKKYILADQPFEMESDVLYRWGLSMKDLLSTQECNVILALFEASGSIVDRNDVAKAIWGDGWRDKYSDWAIDQVIYSIRKKLLLSKEQLKAAKGKGFRLCIE